MPRENPCNDQALASLPRGDAHRACWRNDCDPNTNAMIRVSRDLIVLATFLVVASTANLRAATYSDDNWTAMAGYAGANGPVHAAVVDDAGDLYIAGEFDAVGNVPVNNIAKWNGTNWSALGSGLQFNTGYAVVYALALAGDDLYAAGRFTMAGGVAVNSIAKWNGTNWSALGSGLAGGFANPPFVYALTLSGSDLYAGGTFTAAGGNAANYIAKWNGKSWSALGSGISGAPANWTPRVLTLAASGNDLYVGGAFTNAGGIMARGIAKWDGGTWSSLGPSISDTVTTALAVSGVDVYAAGYFAANVAKWNGTSWSALDSPVGAGIGRPKTLTVSGGELYGAGELKIPLGPSSYTLTAYVAKWSGSNWLQLGSDITQTWWETSDPQVHALAVSGTNVYAGGGFRQAGEIWASCIAKWSGNNWSALGSQLHYLSAMTVSGRDVYGAGGFAAADGTQSNRLVKWDGSGWSPLAPISTGMFVDVSALAVSGNDVYAGGAFTNMAGISANRIARWDGTNWSALGSGIGSESVDALAVSGQDLYVAGFFTMAGGIAANHIAKWNGSSWSALGSGMNQRVFALAVSRGELYAGGWFTTAGGNAASSIAKWDGTNWSALGGGIMGNVYALAAAGTNLYAGGYFGGAGEVGVSSIAKWDGSSWSAVGTELLRYDFDGPDVYALAASGTDLYVGGWFATEFGDFNLAKWDGSNWSGLGSSVDGTATLLAVRDTELFVASEFSAYGYGFTTAGGKIAPGLARARIGSIVKSVALGNGTAPIQLSGVTGYQYHVQRATNISLPTTWTTLSTTPLSPAPDGSFTFTDKSPRPARPFIGQWRCRNPTVPQPSPAAGCAASRRVLFLRHKSTGGGTPPEPAGGDACASPKCHFYPRR